MEIENYISDVSDKPDSEPAEEIKQIIKYRKCASCKLDIQLNGENFYRHSSSKLGFLRRCKACHNKRYLEVLIPDLVDLDLVEKLKALKTEIIEKKKEIQKIRIEKEKLPKEKPLKYIVSVFEKDEQELINFLENKNIIHTKSKIYVSKKNKNL